MRDIHPHTHTDITLEPRLVPQTTKNRLAEGKEAVGDICSREIVHLHNLTVVRRALGAHGTTSFCMARIHIPFKDYHNVSSTQKGS